MAQSDHLPIYKRGYELCLHLEQVARGFSRSNRSLGDELRTGSRRALSLVVRANSRREREPELLALREELEALKVGMRLAHDGPTSENSAIRRLRAFVTGPPGAGTQWGRPFGRPVRSWHHGWHHGHSRLHAIGGLKSSGPSGRVARPGL